MENEILENIVSELRRGSIIIAVLSQLKKPEYGYSLIQKLGDAGFKVDQGTLYPLLRRLEKQGVLKSSWDTVESRPKKYYELTKEGLIIYDKLLIEFNLISKTINNLERND